MSVEGPRATQTPTGVWHSESVVEFPFPQYLGLVLLRRDVELCWLPGHPYRGVDRNLHVPDPTQPIARDVDCAWSAYFDADDDGSLRRNLRLARSLQAGLEAVGEPNEIGYLEVVVLPGRIASLSPEESVLRCDTISRVAERARAVGLPPKNFRSIGFECGDSDAFDPLGDRQSGSEPKGRLVHHKTQ